MKRCKICGLSSDGPLCEICSLSLLQINELYSILKESIIRKEEPPPWTLKASRKIADMLITYPMFAAYENVSSGLILEFLISDESELAAGINLDELEELKTTYIDRDKIIEHLVEMGIIRVDENRNAYPGPFMEYLLDTKKIYGDDFSSSGWSAALSVLKTFIIINLIKEKIDKSIKGEGRLPRQAFTVFRLLSSVVKNEVGNENYRETKQFTISENDWILSTTLLKGGKNKRRFFLNATGIIDVEAKIISDVDENNNLVLHKDLNGLIIHMIERVREMERDRYRESSY